jgi:hypothetical protein
MVMNLAQSMLAGRSLEAFLNERRAQDTKSKHAGQRSKQSTIHNRFMIAQFLKWKSALLTSKVDGEMPLIGSVNIREEFFSLGNSTQKKSVKDCKI